MQNIAELLKKPVSELTEKEFKLVTEHKREKERIDRERKRKVYEELRNGTIEELSPLAEELSLAIERFKSKAFTQMTALYELLQDYSSRHADGKGNYKVESKDFRIIFKRQVKGTFDERSHQAEKHIIDFVNSKFENDADTKDLIMSLLERKKGDLDIQLVQKLYKMEERFNDENWREGIRLLKESYTCDQSKDYINFYKRDRNNKWQLINLNFSSK